MVDTRAGRVAGYLPRQYPERMNHWFTNRGQVLQIGIAAIACAIAAVVAWPSIQAHDFTFGPIVFYGCLLLTLGLFARFLIPASKPSNSPIETPSPSTASSSPPPDTGYYETDVSVATQKCKVGDFIDVSFRGEITRIVVRNIKKSTKNSPDLVEIEQGTVHSDMRPAPDVKRISETRFLLPISAKYSADTTSLYQISFADNFVTVFMLSVTHINTHENEAELKTHSLRSYLRPRSLFNK